MTISNYERSYSQLLAVVQETGRKHQARNATTTRLFNQQLTANLQEGFPMLTGRKLPWDGIKGELLAFIRGNVLLQDFKDLGCNFWDKQALTAKDPNGNEAKHLGPIYGFQWRKFSSVHYNGPDSIEVAFCDQLGMLVQGLIYEPGSRRHVLTAWQPNDLEYMALPPCHIMAQWHVEQTACAASANSTELSMGPGDAPILHCTVTMRSADMFVGVPADMASYALLTELLCLICGFEPGTVCINMADCHIYEANEEQVIIYLDKITFNQPTIGFSQACLDSLTSMVHPSVNNSKEFTLAALKWLEAIEPSDIRLDNYQANENQPVTMVA